MRTLVHFALAVMAITEYKGGTEVRLGQDSAGREGSVSRPGLSSTVTSTHAKQAAMMAEVLRACEIGKASGTAGSIGDVSSEARCKLAEATHAAHLARLVTRDPC
jgi:hypothetical protein